MKYGFILSSGFAAHHFAVVFPCLSAVECLSEGEVSIFFEEFLVDVLDVLHQVEVENFHLDE